MPQDLDVDAAGRIAITGTTAENPSPYVRAVARHAPLRRRRRAAADLPGAGGASVDVDAAGNIVAAGFFVAPPGASAVTRSTRPAQGPVADTARRSAPKASCPALSARFDSSGAVTVAGTVTNVFTHPDDYLTIRFDADGTERWRHQFNGPINGSDRVAGLAVDGGDGAIVAGTSWNNYLSYQRGTADDIVSLRFPAGSQPALEAPSDLDATESRAARSDSVGRTAPAPRPASASNDARASAAPTSRRSPSSPRTTAYIDSRLARNTHYTYRVRAFNSGGASAYSNTASAKTTRR